MTRFHYVGYGAATAPVLVLLHGFMGASADWDALAPALADGRRVLAVDLPGHGRSVGLPERCYTPEGVAEGLLQILDAEGITQADFAGYSMGGRMALFAALTHPERVRRLVLESVSPGLRTPEERARRRATDAERAQRLVVDLRAFLEAWYRQPLFASLSRHEGLVEEMVARRAANDPAELERVLRGMGTGSQPSLWGCLPALAPPTLALVGALDVKYVRLVGEMAPHVAAARIIPGVGHIVHAEDPAAYLYYLKDFLKQS